MNTAHSTSAMEMIGRVTSPMAACAAACGFSPCSILRSMFSTTTMASSTTMPVASTKPNKVNACGDIWIRATVATRTECNKVLEWLQQISRNLQICACLDFGQKKVSLWFGRPAPTRPAE